MIKTINLTKNYGDLCVLNGINTQINRGEVVAVIGPSGGGKSTFLRCLNRLEEPTDGEIIIDGQNILDKKVNINKITVVKDKPKVIYLNISFVLVSSS